MPLLTQHQTTKIVESFAHLEILMGLVAGDFPETLAQFNEADVHDAGQAIWKAANFPQHGPATHRQMVLCLQGYASAISTACTHYLSTHPEDPT